jgi:DNA-binding transcriptional LysR family regulator
MAEAGKPAFLRAAIASVYDRTCAPQVGEQKSARLTATESPSNLEQKRWKQKVRPAFSEVLCALPSVLECRGLFDLVEFRHLKYIAAIAETLNFTRAGERLFLAQPSLSKQIKDLEDGTGIQIFVRHHDGVRITAAGQMIVSYAIEAVKSRNEIIHVARAVHCGEIPPLRIGFSCFVQQDVLRSLSDAYASLFPGCPMQFSGGDPVQILRRMEERNLDAAVLPLPISGDQWTLEPVASAPLAVCMRADGPLAQQTEIQPSELAKRLKIFRNPDAHPEAHARLMEMLAEIGIEPEATCLATTPADIQWMVQSSSGLALIDQKTPLDSSLTTRPIAGVAWTADTAFVHPLSAKHPALPVLIRHLRKVNGSKPAKHTHHRKHANDLQMTLLA